MRSIPFFTDDIKINVHTATRADHVGRTMTIEEFSEGFGVLLYEVENGELMVQSITGAFIEGPEDK